MVSCSLASRVASPTLAPVKRLRRASDDGDTPRREGHAGHLGAMSPLGLSPPPAARSLTRVSLKASAPSVGGTPEPQPAGSGGMPDESVGGNKLVVDAGVGKAVGLDAGANASAEKAAGSDAGVELVDILPGQTPAGVLRTSLRSRSSAPTSHPQLLVRLPSSLRHRRRHRTLPFLWVGRGGLIDPSCRYHDIHDADGGRASPHWSGRALDPRRRG